MMEEKLLDELVCSRYIPFLPTNAPGHRIFHPPSVSPGMKHHSVYPDTLGARNRQISNSIPNPVYPTKIPSRTLHVQDLYLS